MRTLRVLFSMFVALVSVQLMTAQSTTGLPPLGTLLNGTFDTVNYANLNVHFVVPVVSKAGRGMSFTYALGYDSTTYTLVPNGSNIMWRPVNNWGWTPQTASATGYVHYGASQGTCSDHITIYNRYNFDFYMDRIGTRHDFSGVVVFDKTCAGPQSSSGVAIDKSGYSISATSSPSAKMTAKGGAVFNAPLLTGTGNGTITDTNGNKITTDGTTFTDTLGKTALTVTGSNPIVYKYTNPLATTSSVQVHYSAFTVQTNFGCSGVGEYGPTVGNLITSISMPDGTSYQFTYESTPGHSGNVTARIKSVSLPSGGTISYAYTGPNNGIECSKGTAAGVTRTTPDGIWTYSRSGTEPNWVTTIVDPKGNQSIYNFHKIYETERQVYQGTSTLLETIQTCYNGSPWPCNGTPITLPITQRIVTKLLPDASGKVSQAKYLYNTSGLTTEEDDYDFGVGAPGPLLKQTLTSYAGLGNGIVSDPSQITVKDGSGNVKAQTTFGYDETSVTATSGTPQHIGVSGSRGNLTTVTALVQGTSTVKNTLTYFDTGNVKTTQDINSNATTYTYGACGNSFSTLISLPLGLSRSAGWDCNGGIQSSVNDENNQPTTYSYTDPNYWRLTQTSYPDGGQVTTTYNTVTTPWSVTTNTKIDASHTKTVKTIYDGLQRPVQQQLTSDPEGTTFTDTVYDGDGQVSSTSNPYRSTSDPTYGLTSYVYDGLSRTITVTRPDMNTATTAYSGNCNTLTDEAGKQRQLCSDALGRTTSVFEPNSTGQLVIETDYTYDALGNNLGITQKGGNTDTTTWRVSTFSYDDLSRLTQKALPEMGTINYTYPTSTNLCSGGPTQMCTEVNARGTTITYAYDALNRLTSKSYSDTTPALNYFYDQTSYNGLTIVNGKNRRTGMSDGSGVTAWSFDQMGRMSAEKRTISAGGSPVTNSFSYTYNLDGSQATATYPSGRQLSYGYSGAQRPIFLQDTANAVNYALNATYWPTGQLHTVLQGNDHSNAGTTLTQTFNNRLQYSTITASNASQTVLSLSYNYVDGTSHNNATLQQETDNLAIGNNQGFTYDQLNRVAGVTNTSWGDSYVYDPWANLLQKNVTSGTAETLSVAVNAQNHIVNSPIAYDADGNLTNTGTYTNTFDAENRMISAGSATYSYDGDSLRVMKKDSNDSTNSRLYWRGSGVQVLAESDLSGSPQKELIYFNGRLTAFYSNVGNAVHYFFADRIGSIRAVTDTTGATTEWTSNYYPWGQIASGNQGSLDNRYRWVGQEYDPEVQNYSFPYRAYSPQFGRFLSTDPVMGDGTSPQSLARYTYVANNATNGTDPLGLFVSLWDGGTSGCIMCGNNNMQEYLNAQDQGWFGDSWYDLPGQQNAKSQAQRWEQAYAAGVRLAFQAARAQSSSKSVSTLATAKAATTSGDQTPFVEHFQNGQSNSTSTQTSNESSNAPQTPPASQPSDNCTGALIEASVGLVAIAGEVALFVYIAPELAALGALEKSHLLPVIAAPVVLLGDGAKRAMQECNQ